MACLPRHGVKRVFHLCGDFESDVCRYDHGVDPGVGVRVGGDNDDDDGVGGFVFLYQCPLM